MTRALVAGASGSLGHHLLAELRARGHRTTALIRDPAKSDLVEADETVVTDLLEPEPERLDAALVGIDLVFSAAGQSCAVAPSAERRSFREVDTVMNRALLEAALRSGVTRFAYVAVLADTGLRKLDYVAAHEDFAGELIAADVEHTVIRANGFFSSYLELLEAARRGSVPSFSDGTARSNPIHEADLAAACLDALEGNQREVAVGGPQELSRLEEIQLAFAALGREPKVKRVPLALLKAALPLIRLRDRRRAEMIDFIAAINRRDMLAPRHGEQHLSDYLAEHVY
jgi:uncharacterized protein YbjT (DUF2867 family)